MTYARVVIVLHLYSLEQCLNPVLQTSIKICNFVTFNKFLIHLGVHHTCWLAFEDLSLGLETLAGTLEVAAAAAATSDRLVTAMLVQW